MKYLNSAYILSMHPFEINSLKFVFKIIKNNRRRGESSRLKLKIVDKIHFGEEIAENSMGENMNKSKTIFCSFILLCYILLENEQNSGYKWYLAFTLLHTLGIADDYSVMCVCLRERGRERERACNNCKGMMMQMRRV